MLDARLKKRGYIRLHSLLNVIISAYAQCAGCWLEKFVMAVLDPDEETFVAYVASFYIKDIDTSGPRLFTSFHNETNQTHHH